jgi:hypothetical protein
MIWLFHRRGEYLACEVRTCLQNAGFELVMTGTGRHLLEWFPDAAQVEQRWEEVRARLDRDGWDDVYERPRGWARLDLQAAGAGRLRQLPAR